MTSSNTNETTADTTSRESVWRRLLLGKLPLEHETAMFILVNVLDFFMTYWMLMHRPQGRGVFIEANPIARYFLDHWGPIKGMLGLKLCVVGVVCVIAQLIALKKLETARLLLRVGTAAVAVVVVYSLTVYLRGIGG